MKKLTMTLTCILLLCAASPKVRAQNDPVLAGMILLYTDKAQKELKSQEKVMLLQTTGHIWTKEEMERVQIIVELPLQVGGTLYLLLCPNVTGSLQ